ncbi:DUF2807 domain-containing protein [Sorangium sp. So ce269]
MKFYSAITSVLHATALPLMIALAAAGCMAEEGNGELGEKTLSISPEFARVRLDGCPEAMLVDVEVTGEESGEAPSLKVTGDSNLLEVVKAKVADNELNIFCDGRFIAELRLTAHVRTPYLSSVGSYGSSGDVAVKGATSDKFLVQHDGSGSMTVAGLKAQSLEVVTRGATTTTVEMQGVTTVSVDMADAGELELRGDAGSMDIKGIDASQLAALALATQTVTASLTHASKVFVCASDSVKGSVRDDGRIEYDCEPASVDVSISDRGIVTPH